MTFEFRPAKRENVSLLIGVAGGTGSGKTMSAMRLARGLAGDQPFAVIDTESGRAKHYGDLFQPWHHGDLTAPFRPERYAEAIAAADEAGYPVIFVDSASHEWAGEGGMLEWHDDEMRGQESRNMTAWIKPKAAHRKMVNRLLQMRAHVILCFRAEPKVDVRLVNGEMKIVPKATLTGLDGWIPIADKNLPFELAASFLLMADKPGLPRPIKLPDQLKQFVPLDRPLSEETGRLLGEWAAGGKASAAPAPATSDETLTERVLELAAELGITEPTAEAIGKPRADQTRWLRTQVKRMEEELAGREPSQFASMVPAGVAAHEGRG